MMCPLQAAIAVLSVLAMGAPQSPATPAGPESPAATQAASPSPGVDLDALGISLDRIQKAVTRPAGDQAHREPEDLSRRGVRQQADDHRFPRAGLPEGSGAERRHDPPGVPGHGHAEGRPGLCRLHQPPGHGRRRHVHRLAVGAAEGARQIQGCAQRAREGGGDARKCRKRSTPCARPAATPDSRTSSRQRLPAGGETRPATAPMASTARVQEQRPSEMAGVASTLAPMSFSDSSSYVGPAFSTQT